MRIVIILALGLAVCSALPASTKDSSSPASQPPQISNLPALPAQQQQGQQPQQFSNNRQQRDTVSKVPSVDQKKVEVKADNQKQTLPASVPSQVKPKRETPAAVKVGSDNVKPVVNSPQKPQVSNLKPTPAQRQPQQPSNVPNNNQGQKPQQLTNVRQRRDTPSKTVALEQKKPEVKVGQQQNKPEVPKPSPIPAQTKPERDGVNPSPAQVQKPQGLNPSSNPSQNQKPAQIPQQVSNNRPKRETPSKLAQVDQKKPVVKADGQQNKPESPKPLPLPAQTKPKRETPSPVQKPQISNLPSFSNQQQAQKPQSAQIPQQQGSINRQRRDAPSKLVPVEQKKPEVKVNNQQNKPEVPKPSPIPAQTKPKRDAPNPASRPVGANSSPAQNQKPQGSNPSQNQKPQPVQVPSNVRPKREAPSKLAPVDQNKPEIKANDQQKPPIPAQSKPKRETPVGQPNSEFVSKVLADEQSDASDLPSSSFQNQRQILPIALRNTRDTSTIDTAKYKVSSDKKEQNLTQHSQGLPRQTRDTKQQPAPLPQTYDNEGPSYVKPVPVSHILGNQKKADKDSSSESEEDEQKKPEKSSKPTEGSKPSEGLSELPKLATVPLEKSQLEVNTQDGPAPPHHSTSIYSLHPHSRPIHSASQTKVNEESEHQHVPALKPDEAAHSTENRKVPAEVTKEAVHH